MISAGCSGISRFGDGLGGETMFSSWLDWKTTSTLVSWVMLLGAMTMGPTNAMATIAVIAIAAIATSVEGIRI